MRLRGWPQRSLTWRRIAPRRAERFTVIAPDLRGAGGASIPRGGYDERTTARARRRSRASAWRRPWWRATTSARGWPTASRPSGAAALARLAVMEFGLPGFGHEALLAPTPEWEAGANWHLALFTVPPIAEAFGRGRELLGWFFWDRADDEAA